MDLRSIYRIKRKRSTFQILVISPIVFLILVSLFLHNGLLVNPTVEVVVLISFFSASSAWFIFGKYNVVLKESEYLRNYIIINSVISGSFVLMLFLGVTSENLLGLFFMILLLGILLFFYFLIVGVQGEAAYQRFSVEYEKHNKAN